MRKIFLFIPFLLPCLSLNQPSFHSEDREKVTLEHHIRELYQEIVVTTTDLSSDIFRKAIIGYYAVQQKEPLERSALITIIDFRLSSTKKRLWVIDLERRQILYHTLVAHGKNSGEEFANSFSNKVGSNQSSLGFYKTGKTYFGKHGLSLKLHGLEEGFNHQAETRAVVIHGADYVSEAFISQHGRLGRSFGCPALSPQESKEIINLIEGGTCLFIYAHDDVYDQNSLANNLLKAVDYFTTNS